MFSAALRTTVCRTAARPTFAPAASMMARRHMGMRLGGRLENRLGKHLLNDIDLIVCDMAGTTVEEGGVVYQTLQQVMIDDGLSVSNDEMHPWHGAKKEAVIANFALAQGTEEAHLEERIMRISDQFLLKIREVYNSPGGCAPIHPNLRVHFGLLRSKGIKIGLDTGYPPEIQNLLIETLNFETMVDGYISSYQVSEGRPYPYMIHQLMERLKIMDVSRVCKVGDSVRDIEEGRNAGCGLVVGVLSGADSGEAMLEAGADIICDNVCDLPVPVQRGGSSKYRLPDLS